MLIGLFRAVEHTMAEDNAAYSDVVGLIAAGGSATRIEPLPCSKEIYPVGFRAAEDGTLRPKVVGQYLLEKMRAAGATKAYLVLRKGKWDIPAYFGDGSAIDLPLGYLIMNAPWGAPYTLDQAFPFVQDALIVFGFPDILFKPHDALQQLRERQAQTNAAIVLGLFPAHQPQKCDMVQLDEQGRARRIVIKPAATDLQCTWIMAVWTPVFTRFLHEFLATIPVKEYTSGTRRELFVGHVIQAAIDRGLVVETVQFPHGRYTDIGTPDELAQVAESGLLE